MFTKEGRKAILDHLTNQKNLTAGMQVRLAKALPGGSPEDWAFGDMTEATFNGYAAVTLSGMPNATINGDDQGEALSPTITFTAGSAPGTETIYVVYVSAADTSTPATRLMFAFALDTPVVINSEGDQIQRVIDFLSDNLV